MTTAEKKDKFVIMRGQGQSYGTIAKALKVSKATCTAWGRELAQDIQEAKQERKEELFNAYRIGREHYIERLGQTLEKLDKAIQQKDFTEVPLDRLIKLQIEIADRLEATRNPCGEVLESAGTSEILQQIFNIYAQVQAGEITAQDGKSIIEVLEKAHRLHDENDIFGGVFG
jgi:transcriptional regulator